VQKIADVCCGCGTVAFEAQREDLDFWGCDINPVATLIARTKSNYYDVAWVRRYSGRIDEAVKIAGRSIKLSRTARERLHYWYDDEQMQILARLRNAILTVVPASSKYRDFFLCAFSNILKATSRWLTKSIKPQIDPCKVPVKPLPVFRAQVQYMIRAFEQSTPHHRVEATISTANFLTVRTTDVGPMDMIITSPPYVTSYEYADLHQLSSLWLDYADDYRDLRRGSIGSTRHDFNFTREIKLLNRSGSEIVFGLLSKDAAAARSVAKYYLDMQHVARRCAQLLRPKGLALFIIGNTAYKGIVIDNARHLVESLLVAGFRKVSVARRSVSRKILTPYRTRQGRFTRSSAGSHVYGEEFILIAKRQ
jgi:methylase of polypeptide subunit release factors